MIGETIGFLLRNLPAVLLVAALVLAALRRGYGSTAERFLAWILLLPIGVTGLWAGLTHVFFPTVAAAHIGWQTSPFQFEVGVHDGAWGVLGFLCIWIGGLFWLATGLGWSLFMLGATYGHIIQTVREGDYAPYNFFTVFSDGFVAIWLLLLLYLYWREGGFGKCAT